MKPVPYCAPPQKILGPTLQNLVVWAIWRLGFVDPYYVVSGPSFEPEPVE